MTDGWTALGDSTRRAIFECLAERPRAVVELAHVVPVSWPAISQHLKVLHTAGLVGFREEGTRNVYHLRPEGLEPLRRWLDEFWQDALDSFAAFVESQD